MSMIDEWKGKAASYLEDAGKKKDELNRVQSGMRNSHFVSSCGDVLDLGETRFKIYIF
ncbi:hypothetical protein [Thiocystis minor]|uniref:hypothetical protein n=1 Tax=Thiocystis minor TaxID=61597 RepID=UPI0019142D85|nr:hypothetical protein [Thiocystis minor]